MRLKLVSIVFLGLALRLGLMALWHSDDYARFQTGDYILYEVGAQHIVDEGDFSNSLFLPRPFLYPLVVALLGMQPAVVLLANIAFGTLLIPATYTLARRIGLSENVGLGAALVVALEPARVVFSVFLGPEPLANLLLALALIALLNAHERGASAGVLAGIAAGGLLAASALVRPAAYLLWIVLALWLVVTQRRLWQTAAAFALACALPIGAWMLHNHVVFNNPTFSTVAGFTMLYYRAASVEHLATGSEVDEVFLDLTRRVEAAMGRDPNAVDDNTRWGYHAASPELTAAMNRVSLEVFAAHPLMFVATIPVGFARMYGLLPQTSQFAGALAWLETGWNAIFLAGALAGLVMAYRRKQWMLFWVVLLVCAYFTAGTLLVKSAGMDTRERSMLTPLMACAFAACIAWMRSQWARTHVPVHQPLS